MEAGSQGVVATKVRAVVAFEIDEKYTVELAEQVADALQNSSTNN